MIMATESVCQQVTGSEFSYEASDAKHESAEAAALHERLVAYVHALAGGHEPRSGVWVEHSYARARGAPQAPAAHVRVLLAPRASPERADVDVEGAEPPPPGLPGDEPEPDDSDAELDDDWEARVVALAPSAVHARLAEQALDALRHMRLECLARAGRAAAQAAARTAARRLRLALAGALPGAPPAWLHGALLACMPARARRLYRALLGQLARAAPRLARRLAGASAAPAPASALERVGRARGADSRPWLLWLGCGRARLDERWARRLGALLHTRVLGGAGGAGAAPDAWCAAVAGSVRAALTDTLAEAGERPVILGGIGAGAALATALAPGAGGAGGAGGVRGLLLLAPPLLTAEGARDEPDDVLAEVRLPVLVVAGARAAASWRGAARRVTRARPERPRRLLELRGADDALRLPAAARRRLRLPQPALDAAVAEECARWACDVAAGEDVGARAARRRPARAPDDDEYAHLPDAGAGAGGARLVSRGPAGAALALLPPRRTLAAADILRLPIVFADDEPAPDEPPASPLTVTSGSRYTRVIVASRGARAPGPRPAGAGPAAGPGAGPPAARPARPVLLRRGLRVLPRADRSH